MLGMAPKTVRLAPNIGSLKISFMSHLCDNLTKFGANPDTHGMESGSFWMAVLYQRLHGPAVYFMHKAHLN